MYNIYAIQHAYWRVLMIITTYYICTAGDHLHELRTCLYSDRISVAAGKRICRPLIPQSLEWVPLANKPNYNHQSRFSLFSPSLIIHYVSFSTRDTFCRGLHRRSLIISPPRVFSIFVSRVCV